MAQICQRFSHQANATKQVTYNRIRNALRTIGANPSVLMSTPALMPRKPRETTVTDVDFERVFRVARPACQLAMLLAREAGLRQGTLLRLNLSNVNFERREITGRTKRSSTYNVPMTQRLYERLLWAAQGVRDRQQPLISQYKQRVDGSNYHPWYISQMLREAQKWAGMPKAGWTLHDLRRTAARRLYEATGDLRKVQRFLAHANPQMTLWYLGNMAVELLPEEVETITPRKEGTHGA